VARQRAAGKVPPKLRIDAGDLEKFLGPVLFEQEFAGRNPEVGLATGLAWTGAGGEILFIEAAQMAGIGKVEITGHLGDVMRESVQTAYSYVRSRAADLGIPYGVFATNDVHIHFPAGAIPKDGPSAGVAVATCLASLLSGRPVRHDVAMTGELTLRGRVLSVGGIKEKALAAHRARIKTIVIPFGNKKDLGDLPAGVKEGLRIVLAKEVDEVWKESLLTLTISKSEPQREYRGRPSSESVVVARSESTPRESTRRVRRGGGDEPRVQTALQGRQRKPPK
jgi:ATP-dependent Lon protease